MVYLFCVCVCNLKTNKIGNFIETVIACRNRGPPVTRNLCIIYDRKSILSLLFT